MCNLKGKRPLPPATKALKGSETATGKIVRAYPQVAIAADAFKRLRSMLIEFGATPAARGKVEVIKPKSSSRLADLIKRRAREDEFEQYLNS